jgi:TM2 domain-containing membrane protein YozV
MSKFCQACGVELQTPDAFACLNCGKIVGQHAVVVKSKNPLFAALLSFFLSGLGQVYNGQFGKGIMYFAIAIICGLLINVVIGLVLAPIWWIINILDAYSTAKRINQGEQFDNFINLSSS